MLISFEYRNDIPMKRKGILTPNIKVLVIIKISDDLNGKMILFTQPLRSGRIWHKVNF